MKIIKYLFIVVLSVAMIMGLFSLGAPATKPSTLLAQPPIVSLSITGPDTVAPGENLTWVATVSGYNDFSATTFRLVLPPGVDIVEARGNAGACTVVGSTITYNLGPDLVNPEGEDMEVVNITVRVAPDYHIEADFQDSIQVMGEVFYLEPNDGDVEVILVQAETVTQVVPRADLWVQKMVKPDWSSPAGEVFAYIITVKNLGPSVARSVVVVDHMATGFDMPDAPAMTIATSAGDYTVVVTGGLSEKTITYTRNSNMDPGETDYMLVSVIVNETATVNNMVEVSSPDDPIIDNNQAKETMVVTDVADLEILKTDSPDPVVAGSNLTYTLEVTNTGPSTADNVVVKDMLPAQVTLVSCTPSSGSCIPGVPGDASQPIIWNIGSLNYGETNIITVVVNVNHDVPDGTVLFNNAIVSSDIFDPDNSDNIVSESTTVQTQADLAITKTSDASTYKQSTIMTYIITVVNNGPSDALNVVVTDNLPPTTQAVYVSDTGGCTISGLTLTCNLGYIAAGQSKSFKICLRTKAIGNVSNTASVTSSTNDPDPGNNSSTLVVEIIQ